MAATRTIEQVFDTAWASFKTNTSFWILGNSFDTITDYLTLYLKGQGNLTTYGSDGYAQALAGKNEAWYDDDGWWVIAALNACNSAEMLGWQAVEPLFHSFCMEKWRRFNLYGPNIWRYCASTLIIGAAPYTTNYGLAPKRVGGVWNAGWAVPGYPIPKDQDFWSGVEPWNGPLGGFQNTVTNGLYCVAAQRLAMADVPAPSDGISNRACADAEFGFLTSWFADPDAPLLNQAASPQPGKHPAYGALVRERVGQYRDPAIRVASYDADQAWTGDQGIVLSAMVDRMLLLEKTGQTSLPDYQLALDTATAILDGVQGDPGNAGALNLIDTSGVLHNWPIGGNPPGSAPDAYCTGVGAFMRYLTYAYVNSAPIRQYCNTVQPGQSQTFSQSIIAMTGSVMTSDYTVGTPTTDSYLQEFTAGAQVSYDVTALGVMLAAYVMQTMR